MSHSNNDNTQQPQSPSGRSVQSNPVELQSLSTDNDDLHPALSCLASCWRVLSWLVSIILYIIEILVLAWAAYTYGSNALYLLFGLTLAYLPLPTVILATVSLVWYYNLDRFHRRRRDRDPHNLSFVEYRKKLTAGAITMHVFLLGMVYRYGQLIYLTILGKRSSLPYLRRDTTLLRFLHSTLVSAPQLVIHLYAILLALSPTDPLFPSPINPPILAAIGLSFLSLVYAVLAFTTNDRLSGKNRRVVLPAHVIQTLWYLCVTASRVIALAVFAYSHGYWVLVVIGGHWLLMFFFLLIQRTTFCADIELQRSSSDNGSRLQRVYKRRWSLEIPFYFVAASVYIFTFFNMKHGKSWYLLTPFHMLMFAENVAMGVLFYLKLSHLMYAEAALTVVAGLYPVGIFFMVIYYCLCHPKRTKQWYWVGVPRRINCQDCCCWCCCCCLDDREGVEPVGYRNSTSVVISGPTLISHNGFLPDNMIPVGAPTSSLTQGVTESEDVITRYESRNNTDGGTARIGQRQEPQNGFLSQAMTGSDSVTNAENAANINAGYMPQLSLNTPSESLPVFSDAPSRLQSELDTDVDSNVIHEGEQIDTVIDTPLTGFTPEPFDLNAVQMLQRNGRTKSLDRESQRADTIDTGIELEPEDAALTPGTTSVTKSDDVGGHHQFLDIPAKRRNYLSERSKLEQHYFPEERHHHHQQQQQQQQQLQQQNNGNQRIKDSGSVTPTLPTPNWSPSPASMSPHSGRVTWGQHTTTSDSSPERQQRNVTPGTLSSQSHQIPDRSRRNNSAPRSPKGARAFSVNPQGATGYNSSMQVDQTESQMGFGHDNRRNIAPRSPKGARRMMVNRQQTYPTGTPSYPPQEHGFISGQSPERSGSYLPPSTHGSPARQPRGAYGYPPTHSSPERVRHQSLPQHMIPQHINNNRGYPAVQRSPPRLLRGASTPSYNQTRDDRFSASGHDHDSRWDHWTAQNTQFNAAQAMATQIRVEGASGSVGGGSEDARSRRSSSGLHKENSPAARSVNSMDADRSHSFKIIRTTPKVNPYYSPHVARRRDTDPNPLSMPQLRRTPASRERTPNYQSQYPRHSGEFNPRFSTDFDNRSYRSSSHGTGGGGGGMLSESYPSPSMAGTNGHLMVQRSPHYPRMPQGAAGARAPRMVRSPPQNRLKSISPQRSIISFGSGVGGGGGGGWLQGGGAEGGARGGAPVGGSTASATSSRPNSLHSTSAFPPLHHHHLHPGLAVRYSDGASASSVPWSGQNLQWSAAGRSPRVNSIQLHVPRSSAHESAV